MEKSYYRGPWRVLWGVAREYGVLGLLRLAIQSLYNQSKNCIHIHGTKSNTSGECCHPSGLSLVTATFCDINGQDLKMHLG